MAESEDVEDQRLDSAIGISFWLDSCSSWMGSSWLVGNIDLSKK